jgi:hypothetical protein
MDEPPSSPACPLDFVSKFTVRPIQGSLPIRGFRSAIQIDGSSLSGLFTRVEISHMVIGSVGDYRPIVAKHGRGRSLTPNLLWVSLSATYELELKTRALIPR